MESKMQNHVTRNGSAAVLDKPRNTQESCHHYWVIEMPKGPTSRGRCKFCGTEREFDNLGPDSWRYGDISELLTTNLRDIMSEGA
jgi:hypothetical protein